MDLIKKNGFWVILVLYLIILFLAKDMPVFWDMYGQVKTAHYYLETGFTNLLPNGGNFSDNGHLPLYAVYLAFLFKLFGFKLWVAHFSVLPFLAGALWQLQKFCKRFLSEGNTLLVLALTLCLPAFATQSLYFSNEVAMVFFSLWLLNGFLYARASHIALASVFLCLFNLRGISFCSILFFYFLLIKKDKNAWYVSCGVIAWAVWVMLHYKLTGWFFQGEEIKEFRTIASPEGMGRNFLLSLWKMIDLGAVFGWVAVVIISIRQKSISQPLLFLALAVFSVLLISIPFTNPISNRYFLLIYVLLLPAFVYSITFLNKKLPYFIAVSFAVVLFSANGSMNDNRYGNAWDCSLKSIPYFELRKQLDAYVAEQKISPQQVSAGFQLYFNDRYYLMNDSEKEYDLLSDTEMPVTEYVADSDICNNYNAEREQFLIENYSLVKSFRGGAVYINLYKKNTKL